MLQSSGPVGFSELVLLLLRTQFYRRNNCVVKWNGTKRGYFLSLVEDSWAKTLAAAQSHCRIKCLMLSSFFHNLIVALVFNNCKKKTKKPYCVFFFLRMDLDHIYFTLDTWGLELWMDGLSHFCCTLYKITAAILPVHLYWTLNYIKLLRRSFTVDLSNCNSGIIV